MDRGERERGGTDKESGGKMGSDRGRNPNATKEQVLNVVEHNVFESLEAVGSTLDDMIEFWSTFASFVGEGYTEMESFLKMKMLPRYQENKTMFDYFCFIGLTSFTKKLIKEISGRI